MKRPAFQFYPGDWQRDANLRRCSHAARGAWMDVLCLLHDAAEYGVLRWPLVDIASAAGAPIKLLRELASKGVLKGSDNEAIEYAFRASHAGKLGDPVILVRSGPGPCWYSGRFVKDEYVRQRRGASTRFEADNQPPKEQPKRAPDPEPKGGIGGRQGYGASSSSSSAELRDSSASTGDNPTPTQAGRACLLMREAGCPGTNPSHPELLAALADGVTPEDLAATAREGIEAGKAKPFAWACITARGRHAEGPRTIATTTAGGSATGRAPSWQAQGVSEILGEANDERAEVQHPGPLVRGTDPQVPRGPFPAQPRRLASG